MAYIGKTPVIGNFVKLDSITVVNGQAAYTMQNGGVNFTSYDNVNQFLVSLNGILQAPTDSFTVSGSTLTFASNLSTGDVIDFVLVLGNSLDIGTPSDNTISTAKLQDNAITSAKLASGAVQNQSAFKNIIINGDMSIAQRGTSFADSSTYNLDRFNFGKSNDGAVTVTQDTDVPSGQGFSKSLKVDVTTADTSIGASQFAILAQRIEAQNLQYLKYGTANAETLTLSFWVKSNKTGTYCVSLVKIDNTRYDYVAEYSISSASTWEKKTITIAPDSNIKAAGGAIDNDNGIGFYLQFALADGSSRQGTNETWNTSTPATSTSNQVNFLDSTSNEWYITGVQLEAGTSASDFEFLPYDVNLKRCQRYYWRNNSSNSSFGSGVFSTSTAPQLYVQHPTNMRAAPSFSFGSNINVGSGSASNTVSSLSVNSGIFTSFVTCNLSGSGGNAQNGAVGYITSGYIDASSEL